MTRDPRVDPSVADDLRAAVPRSVSSRGASSRGTAWRIGLGLVIGLVLVRSVAFVWWPDPHFDADQAVTGLQARHLAEGRAFPVFQYGQQYVLVLESWLAAPFVAIAPESPGAVKIVPLACNVAVAVLLYLTLTSAAVGLAPFVALLATLPVALPGPRTSKDLLDALGMNIEPLLFTLLIWRWRERPLLLGITAALGIKNREFTMYAVAALIAVELLQALFAVWRDRESVRNPRDASRFLAIATVTFALTWTAVGLLKQFSSPSGPGTTPAILADAKDNMAVASSAMCIVPALMPGDFRIVAMRLLPLQLGIGDERLNGAQTIAPPINYAAWWPPIAAILILGAARGLWRAWRQGPSHATWFGLFLMMVGAQAVLVYASTRCGHASVFTLRYTLLSLLMPAGAIVLALERESRPALRRVMAGGVAAWIGVCAFAHARVLIEHVTHPPRASYRELARYLDARQVRFIHTDYWTGYHVAFLTGERIKALTDFERIHDYTLAVSANLDQVVDVRRLHDTPCANAVIVATRFYVCDPRSTATSSPPPQP